MKSLSIFILISLFSLSNFHKNDHSKENLKGRVKLIQNKRFTVSDKSETIEAGYLISCYYYKYNKSRNIAQVIKYANDESLEWKKVIKYDDSLKKIEEKWYCKEEEKPTMKVTYKYDETGNLIEEYLWKDFDESQLLTKYTFKHDLKDRIIKKNTWQGSFNFTLSWQYEYRYNKNGNLSEYFVYDYDRKLYRRETYKYDEDGNKIEETWYNPESNLITTKSTFEYYNYDKAGNWTKSIIYKDEKPINIIERTIQYYE